MTTPHDNLAAALAAHRIELPPPQVELLDRYARLLWEWNGKLNLTRHTDYEKFAGRDVADALAFAEFLEPGEKALDVGTGGGLPGIILAVVRPDLRLWLCEPVGKKARAVADMIDQLALNVPVLQGRAQDLLGPAQFNTLVIRAVARLSELLAWFAPHWSEFDRLLAIKGPAWADERGDARHRGLLHGLALRKLKSYPLPGNESESVVLQVCPKDRLEDEKRCRLRGLGA
jgi:16S rRNA (guanine527-N7)-methyltransferase